MTLFDNLEKHINGEDIICYLHMGKYSEKSGSCIIDEIYFNKTLDKIKNFISRQFTTVQYKCYKYFEKELQVFKHQRIVLLKNPLHCNLQNNACLSVYEEYEVDLENFPIIDKYTDVSDITTKTFTLKKIPEIEISLVKEYVESTNTCMMQIKFPIKYIDNVKLLMGYIFG